MSQLIRLDTSYTGIDVFDYATYAFVIHCPSVNDKLIQIYVNIICQP